MERIRQMRQARSTDEKFEWDMTVIVVLVLLVGFLLLLVEAIGPLGHTT